MLSEWQRRVRAQDNASHDNTVAKSTLFFSTRLCSATKAAAFPSSRPQSVQRKVTPCVCVCVCVCVCLAVFLFAALPRIGSPVHPTISPSDKRPFVRRDDKPPHRFAIIPGQLLQFAPYLPSQTIFPGIFASSRRGSKEILNHDGLVFTCAVS